MERQQTPFNLTDIIPTHNNTHFVCVLGYYGNFLIKLIARSMVIKASIVVEHLQTGKKFKDKRIISA